MKCGFTTSEQNGCSFEAIKSYIKSGATIAVAHDSINKGISGTHIFELPEGAIRFGHEVGKTTHSFGMDTDVCVSIRKVLKKEFNRGSARKVIKVDIWKLFETGNLLKVVADVKKHKFTPTYLEVTNLHTNEVVFESEFENKKPHAINNFNDVLTAKEGK